VTARPVSPVGLPSAFWLGGGCGSGKSTVARRVAHRLDLRLYAVDAHTYDHAERAADGDFPHWQAVVAMAAEERWERDPAELAATFVAVSAELLEMVRADLQALGSGPTVVIEGPQLFPDLVSPGLESPEHGIWLIPSAEFGRQGVAGRLERYPAAGAQRRYQRDLLLTAINQRQAAAHGLRTLVIDGSLSADQVAAVVTRQLERLPGGLRRAADGRERQQVRRAENAVVVRQLLGWWADLGPERMPEAPVFPFCCECESPGCDREVRLPVTDYQLRSPSGPVTATAHG
jgi:hypothetical protein